MKGKQILKKRSLAILRAAIYGSVSFVGLNFAANAAYGMWGRDRGLMSDLASCFGFVLTLPSALLSGAVGHKGGLMNEHLVNGVLGALLFAIIAAFWQFVVKSYEE